MRVGAAYGKCLQRQLIETSFQYGPQRVTLMITHIEYQCLQDRRLQTEFVAERIRNTTGYVWLTLFFDHPPSASRLIPFYLFICSPLIVLGDFNLQATAPEMAPIFATGVKDATIEAGTSTHTEVVVGEGQVDFVLFRDLKVIDARVDDLPHDVSDHRPVIATFALL
jgi:endonuclease/exonuclease/phosphatase family metal-dependent hydrolase